MGVCSCSAGVMWHCRTAISRTCSFVTVDMLKPVNTDLSGHTVLNGHFSCRSCRQYIKPTLTGHLTCRSCRQYIKPKLSCHLTCRSCRQYIKPTLIGHFSCESCRQYIMPTLATPVDSLFYHHSVHSANSPPASYCLNICFCIFPSSKSNQVRNFFQKSVESVRLTITCS